MSMETLRGDAEKKIEEGRQKVETAKEMRSEIDDLKAGLEGLNGDLDEEIKASIQAAEQAGRDQAASEINDVQNQASQDQAQAEAIKAQTDAKISENNAARSSLEGLKSNKYGGGIDSSISAIEQNNAIGEEIKSKVDSDFQSIMSDIQSAASGV